MHFILLTIVKVGAKEVHCQKGGVFKTLLRRGLCLTHCFRCSARQIQCQDASWWNFSWVWLKLKLHLNRKKLTAFMKNCVWFSADALACFQAQSGKKAGFGWP